MAYYSRPEEVLKRFREIFTARGESLGIKYIAIQDENLRPEYPALEISAGPLLRDIQTTHKFGVIFEMSFWIYHANFESTHASRTIEDMELATNIVRFLHQPGIRTLEDDSDPGPNKNKIIFGYVVQETPGVIARAIVATRLVWRGQSEVSFNDS